MRRHKTTAPPAKLKKMRKKELAANAIDRPNTIWISFLNPPELSPKERLRPVTIMTITAMILATGHSIDWRMLSSGPSHGIDDPEEWDASGQAATSIAPKRDRKSVV